MTQELKHCPRETFGKTWTHYALDMHVLCIAVKGVIDDWSAYIGAVPGKNHTDEAELVAKDGSKLPYWIAKKLFPSMDEAYEWRI